MTKEEFMANVQYLNVKDIMKTFDCGESTAYKTIREIKSVSNTFKHGAKVTMKDVEKWLECGGETPKPQNVVR